MVGSAPAAIACLNRYPQPITYLGLVRNKTHLAFVENVVTLWMLKQMRTEGSRFYEATLADEIKQFFPEAPMVDETIPEEDDQDIEQDEP